MKKRHLKLLLALCLAAMLLITGALAADEAGESLFIGDVELVGSADSPVYAMTDASGTVTSNGAERAAYARLGRVIVAPLEGLQLSMVAGDDADSAADIKGSPFRIETDITDLVAEYKYLSCTVSPRAASIFVGGEELTSTDGAPVYATTDASGTVKPGGSEDNYNVKWDGGTLTLRDANVTGSNPFDLEAGDYSGNAAIVGNVTYELKLVGSNTVTGPAIGSGGYGFGIASTGGLVISGEGSLSVTGEYDGISAYGDLTITGGTVNAQGFYAKNDASITGGVVNCIGYGETAAFYIFFDFDISGGTINVTGDGNGLDGGSLNISGGTINADCGQAPVIGCEVNISGGTVNASTTSTEYGAIHAADYDINISGGTVSATGAVNALMAPEGEVNITTADGRELTACAGESAESAAALEGSPFLEADVISGLVEGQKYFSSSAAIPFTDVSGYSWYYDAVKYVYANGLMDGTGAASFAPGSNMTRAMLWPSSHASTARPSPARAGRRTREPGPWRPGSPTARTRTAL